MPLLPLLLLLLVLPPHPPLAWAKGGGGGARVYSQQFPPGSEHLPLPEGGIIAFSIFLGRVKYAYLSLTLESMRWNAPAVQFVLVNVVEREEEANDVREALARRPLGVSNFHLEVVTCARFSQLVKDRLGVAAAFNSSWFYKMTDYKPTLAALFPHLIDEPPPRGRRQHPTIPFAYWGYVDSDLVWGNFSRFSALFRAGHSVITSDYQGASGVAMFFANDVWGRELFRRGDPLYSSLLAEREDYQLDEFSRKGKHSEATMDRIIAREIERSAAAGGGAASSPSSSASSPSSSPSSASSPSSPGSSAGGPSLSAVAAIPRTVNRGLHWKDKLWLEADGAHTWAGPARWFQGSLQIVRASFEFPASRELLIFHRPIKEYDLWTKHGRRVAAEVEADMIKYGYLLPNWVPLLTRHVCAGAASQWQPQSAALAGHRPYDESCFARHRREAEAAV